MSQGATRPTPDRRNTGIVLLVLGIVFLVIGVPALVFACIVLVPAMLLLIGVGVAVNADAEAVQAEQMMKLKAAEDKQRDENEVFKEMQRFAEANLGPSPATGTLAAKSPFWEKLRRSVANANVELSGLKGPGRDLDRGFDDDGIAGSPGVLVGLLTSDTADALSKVTYVQPIFLTAQGEKAGKHWGLPLKNRPLHALKAKEGYAVGGIKMRSGVAIHQVQLVFMKVDGERLNDADQYLSPAVGSNGGGPGEILSKGPFVVGIYGTRAERDDFAPTGSPTSLGFFFTKN